jgi:hypothetical protein
MKVENLSAACGWGLKKQAQKYFLQCHANESVKMELVFPLKAGVRVPGNTCVLPAGFHAVADGSPL